MATRIQRNDTTGGDKDSSIITTVYINLGITLLAFIAFLILRKKLHRVYSANCTDDNPAPNTYFSWIIPMIRRNHVDIMNKHGLDVLMYVLVVKYMFAMIVWMAIFSIITMAVNATSSAKHLPPNDPDHVEGITILSMANITRAESVRFWTHILQILWNTIGCILLCTLMWNKFLTYKRILIQKQLIHNYTVCVSQVDKGNIPNLTQYFDNLFPGEVARIQPVYQVPKVLKLKQKRMKYVLALEKAREKQQRKGQEIEAHQAPAHCLACSPLFCCTKKVPAVGYYADQIQQTETEIQQHQANYSVPHVTSVFVTFNTITTAKNCANSFLLLGKSLNAPEPNNVRWQNHFARNFHRNLATWIVNIIIFFIVLFFFIPVGFATALANLEDLAQLQPMAFLRPVLQFTTLVSIINGILPSLVIMIFFLLLQLVIYQLIDQTKPYSNSKLDTRAFKKMFIFYLVNVFLVSILATTFWGIIDQLESLVTQANALSVLLLLATSLPLQAVFFMNYVIVAGITARTVQLLLIGDIVMRYFYKYTAKTTRDKILHTFPNHYQLWTPMAQNLLIFLIIVTYSTIAPVILFFGLLYFAIAVFSTCYVTTYVTRQYYDGFGGMFPAIHNRIVICLMVYQLTLCGVFILNVFTAGAIIAALCFIGTFMYRIYSNKRMREVTKYGYYDDWVKGEPLPEGYRNAYLTPLLWDATVDLEEINDQGMEKELRKRLNEEVV